MTNVADSPATAKAVHPLEPLSEEEVSRTARILRESGHLEGDVAIAYITLHEPPKGAVLEGRDVSREALVVAVDRGAATTCRSVVSLSEARVVSWDVVTAGQAPITADLADMARVQSAVKAHPGWREALAKRGVTDIENVQIDPWPAGHFGLDIEEGHRLVRCIAYVRDKVGDNGYARPIENVIAFADLNTGEVVDVHDYGVVPIPPEKANFDEESAGPARTDLKPLDIIQPQGPSFEVDGHFVKWQKWSFRVSMHPVDGLVLHTVGYEDQGRVRPILYRASLAEMVVPYGETSPMNCWKNAFDAGEAGLGRLVNSLELGCDCLGTIHYFDAIANDAEGNPHRIANAICMHEEDYGILWKHFDYDSQQAHVRRSRRLVVSSIHTIGNYEYGFFWYFYQDGTLQMEVKLTGVLQTQAAQPGETEFKHSVPIAPQLVAPHHQHLFNFRLDFDIDGTTNTVSEVDVEAVPMGPDNPLGNAFVTKSTAITRESEGERMCDFPRNRVWSIENPSVKNRLGQPVAYRLLPGAAQTMLAHPDSSVAKRATFGRKNLWVTRYDPAELHASGDFPNQHPGGDGLPRYIAQDRPLENEDVVLWYTAGVTHIARPEDWPVMPVEYAGFMLKPAGFFDRNPALDVPPTHSDHCVDHSADGHHDGHQHDHHDGHGHHDGHH